MYPVSIITYVLIILDTFNTGATETIKKDYIEYFLSKFF